MTGADPEGHPPLATRPGTTVPLRGAWGALVVLGVLTAGAGVLAIAYPKITLAVVAIILGINLIVLGVVDLVDALMDDEDRDGVGRTLQAVLGVAGVIVGTVVLRKPGNSLLVLVVAVGLYLLVVGLVAAVRAIVVASPHRALRFVLGLAAAALGIVLLAVPELGLATFAVLAGIGLIARGIQVVVLGLSVRGRGAAG